MAKDIIELILSGELNESSQDHFVNCFDSELLSQTVTMP